MLTPLRDLLLELGRGSAFVGSQVPLEVGGRCFYIDLLFYHLRLHCYFVIELKAVEFEPEHAGKLTFYISAVDEVPTLEDLKEVVTKLRGAMETLRRERQDEE